jgi:hypothetical protein
MIAGVKLMMTLGITVVLFVVAEGKHQICSLKKDPGKCRLGQFWSYYYDSEQVSSIDVHSSVHF